MRYIVEFVVSQMQDDPGVWDVVDTQTGEVVETFGADGASTAETLAAGLNARSCLHCGKTFEAESRGNVICPACRMLFKTA